ncbi:hypothetical protein [Mycobacterium lepromatosis]|uniref:hypothetical protein n=1 Tax=Mycobacterium lepromatosis TaxID=480418 RepID=UPI000AB7333C|nr:hypothetical protein [Mycobacterium lepromatosis]
MRLLFALLGATAMIGLAAPACAGPDGDGKGLLAALQQTDIGFNEAGSSCRVRQSGMYVLATTANRVWN